VEVGELVGASAAEALVSMPRGVSFDRRDPLVPAASTPVRFDRAPRHTEAGCDGPVRSRFRRQ